MPRAKKPCPKPHCRLTAPCPKHKVWKESKNQVPLPPGWAKLRKLILKDGVCYITGCGIRTNLALDHIIPRSEGGSNAPSNLAPICTDHHAAKTATERLRGIKRRQASS